MVHRHPLIHGLGHLPNPWIGAFSLT
jgi:hypothetical protein